MSAMASQINSLTIVYSTVYSGVDQRKHQSSASLAFVRGIHWWPVNSPHKWPVTRRCLHLMPSSWLANVINAIFPFTCSICWKCQPCISRYSMKSCQWCIDTCMLHYKVNNKFACICYSKWYAIVYVSKDEKVVFNRKTYRLCVYNYYVVCISYRSLTNLDPSMDM